MVGDYRSFWWLWWGENGVVACIFSVVGAWVGVDINAAVVWFGAGVAG